MDKILVVDDHDLNRILTQEILRIAGYQVIGSNCGEDAVIIALKEKPALIILDVMMPGLGGISTMRIIHEGKETQHIPILALTAMAMPSEQQVLLEQGFDAYVSKPFQVDELVKTVKHCLMVGRSIADGVID